MKKLFEILGQRRIEGDVGIEIEVEGARFPDEVDGRWISDRDGSLRGENREYILAGPIHIDTVKNALTCLKDNLTKAKSKLSFSFRTSVHVHINVQDLTHDQYLNMLYTYLLLEEPLMTYCGKERKGNRFCLRVQDAEGCVHHLQRLFKEGSSGFNEIPHDTMRYSALNVEATKKYGSLEFRGMRGNLEVETLDTWCKALWSLREFAKSVNSPVDVYNLYAELEPQGFLNHVLGGLSVHFDYPKMVRDVQRSFSLSIDLPYAYRKVADVAPKVDAELKKRQRIAFNHVDGGGILPQHYMEIKDFPNPPEGKEWFFIPGEQGWKWRDIQEQLANPAVEAVLKAVHNARRGAPPHAAVLEGMA